MLRLVFSIFLVLSLSSCELEIRKTVEGLNGVAKFANGNVDLGLFASNETANKAVNALYKAGVSAAHFMAPGYVSGCVYVLEKGTGYILKCMDKNNEKFYLKALRDFDPNDLQIQKSAERATKRRLRKAITRLTAPNNTRQQITLKFKISLPDDLSQALDEITTDYPGYIPNDDQYGSEEPPILQFR